MATSVESSSPASLNRGTTSFMGSSPLFSPSSDKRFWSTLRCRVDTLLDNRKPIDESLPNQNAGEENHGKRLKEDSLLLLRGFDSVSYSLSQLSNNLENALQGARDLARPPTLTELLHSTLEKVNTKEDEPKEEEEEAEEEIEKGKKGVKRKLDSQESSEDQGDDSLKQYVQSPKELGKLKKAKNLAISMATKAASLARELKSIKSDVCFMQDRCTLLEEENRRLRDGFDKGMRPEEDDLVRLQLEVLLAEKSRLANENANLTRENQCLHQLVEYHQLTSQDLSASYENLIKGMCLDFSSPPPPSSIPEVDIEEDGNEASRTPQEDLFGLPTCLDERYDEEEEEETVKEDC